jgi:hypothetical protein
MTPLRARMIEDMKLAGLAERTQEVYLQAVRGLAKRYDRSPDTDRGGGPPIFAWGPRAGRRQRAVQDLPLRDQVFLLQHARRGLAAIQKNPAPETEAATADALSCRGLMTVFFRWYGRCHATLANEKSTDR